jgi:hypothetical protein
MSSGASDWASATSSPESTAVGLCGCRAFMIAELAAYLPCGVLVLDEADLYYETRTVKHPLSDPTRTVICHSPACGMRRSPGKNRGNMSTPPAVPCSRSTTTASPAPSTRVAWMCAAVAC